MLTNFYTREDEKIEKIGFLANKLLQKKKRLFTSHSSRSAKPNDDGVPLAHKTDFQITVNYNFDFTCSSRFFHHLALRPSRLIRIKEPLLLAKSLVCEGSCTGSSLYVRIVVTQSLPSCFLFIIT